MEFDIKKLDEVLTRDDKKLGLAQQLFHRVDEVNPALQLYASYLEVEDYNYGWVIYVPTDYIEDRDDETRTMRLSVKYDEVMRRTWFRMPDFVAHGKDRKETLPSS